MNNNQTVSIKQTTNKKKIKASLWCSIRSIIYQFSAHDRAHHRYKRLRFTINKVITFKYKMFGR